MIKMTAERAKGTRDFIPEDNIIRTGVINIIKGTFENYGFSPMDTPIIEKYETLASKYAGGSEILKETFKLKDQGDRDLGLRYDLTVPFARVIAMNPQLRMPFKRYQIGEVFRDGPIKLGRYREFTQCDVDVVGSKNMLLDAECVMIMQEAFSRLGLDVIIEVNNRKILDSLMEYVSIPPEKRDSVIISLDKIKKVGEAAVKSELEGLGIDRESINNLLKICTIKGANKEKINKLKNIIATPGIQEIEEIFSVIDDKNVEFNISLARGLSYYTSTVFEAFVKDKDFKSSLAGGGRYDNMIGSFLEGKREMPAVGFSFGLDPIIDILKKERSVKKTVVDVYLIPIGTEKKALEILTKFRKEGINADMDFMSRNIGKNLEYANSLGIPFVVFVGEKELKAKKVKIRDMKTGKEKLLGVKEVVKTLLKSS